MIAQLPLPSPEELDSWGRFIVLVGLPAIFAIVLLGFFLWFVWRALTKWDVHLTRQEQLMKSQTHLCTTIHGPGGPANVVDMREAAHQFAFALEEVANGISDETAAAVRVPVQRIHEILRNAPTPMAWPQPNGQADG